MPGENPGENEPKAFFRRTLVVEAAGSGVAEVSSSSSSSEKSFSLSPKVAVAAEH